MSRLSTPASGSAPPLPSGSEGQYCFLVEWFDAQASLMRQFHLLYFTADDTLELFDLKNRRTFLKRCSYPSVRLADLYLGASVSVYARQLRIIDYGDAWTAAKLRVSKGRSLALVKPSAYEQWGRILTAINQAGFKVGRLKSVLLSASQAQSFYGDRDRSARASELAQGPVLAIEIIGADVHSALLDAMQPSTSAGADAQEFGAAMRAVHVAQSERSAEAELDFLFNNPALASTATFTHCTLALIKPHCVAAGQAGAVVDSILRSGFDISAMEAFHLDKAGAEEFAEVYKGVLPDYHNLIEQLTSGPVIAMEIRAPPQLLQDENGNARSVVSAFRALCGPSDPEIARHLRPRSLRALFGQSKVKNAVHCTDLEEDAQYFFDILQQTNKAMPTSTPAQIAATMRR